VLFGLAQAMPHVWTTNRIFLVEGAFDVFPLQRHIPETLATLTAHVLEALVRILRRANVRDLWAGYDTDKTGLESFQKVREHYGSEFKLETARWDHAKLFNGRHTKDPSELWETWGETKFSNHVRSNFADIIARG